MNQPFWTVPETCYPLLHPSAACQRLTLGKQRRCRAPTIPNPCGHPSAKSGLLCNSGMLFSAWIPLHLSWHRCEVAISVHGCAWWISALSSQTNMFAFHLWETIKKTTCAVSLGHFTYLTTPCPLNTKSRYWWARWWCRADTAWWTQSGPSIQEPADLWIFKIPIFWAPIIAGGCGISPDLTSPIDTYNPIVVMWYTQ